MNADKLVEVLCLNGRRQKIKAPSNQTILQVLKEACKKHGFNDAEVDLMHKRKLLDVTLTIKHASIPNNGKLEMIKRDIPRRALQVHVALQTEFCERLQHSFEASCSLYDILKHWDEEPNSAHSGKMLIKTPVIVYMTRQISGIANLKSTTLEQLGLIGGRAAMRLTHREENNENSPEDIKTQTTPLKNTCLAEKRDATICQKSPTEVPSKVERSETSVSPMEVSDNVAGKETSVSSVAMHSSVLDSTSPEEPKLKKQKSERIPPRQLADDVSETDIQMASARVFPHREFKFPETREDPRDSMQHIEAIDPQQIKMEMKLSMACARNPVVFHLDHKDSHATADIQEPSEDFFEVTIDDLKKMLIGKKTSVEDEPLMTKNMREAKEKEKLCLYKMTIIRIHFPGKMVLQGCFRPLEKISALKEFVLEHLQEKNTKFNLFTTPPKCILKNLDVTLHSAKLAPTAVVHVSSQTDKLLKQEFIDNAVTYKEAELAAFNIINRYNTQKEDPLQTTDTSSSANHESVQQDSRQPFSNSRMPQQTVKKSSNAPKWLQLGKR